VVVLVILPADGLMLLAEKTIEYDLIVKETFLLKSLDFSPAKSQRKSTRTRCTISPHLLDASRKTF